MVGTSTATCFLSSTALKAARSATSVFPYPTSPQTSRSIGRGFCMSASTSSMAFAWSGVSSNSKSASNVRYMLSGGLKAYPWCAARAA